jgi:hypothetical protein
VEMKILPIKDKRRTSITLEAYGDEIFNQRCPSDNSIWNYIGLLFVPVKKKEEVLKTLKNLRCIKNENWYDDNSNCPHRCGYHRKNNTEIHFNELDKQNARFRIAKRWINYVIRKGVFREDFYFNIIGINLTNLNLKLFGERSSKRDCNIYSRFFRSTFSGALNYLFKSFKKIVIKRIFHDIGPQQEHDYFPWHMMTKLDQNLENIKFKNPNIKFIDSDHRRSNLDESQYIQLIDLILGATLLNLHKQSKQNEQREVALIFKPSLKTLLSRKKINGEYYGYGKYYNSKYYRKCSISFFPKKQIKKEKLERNDISLEKDDNFYFNREIILTQGKQTSLEKFLK